MSLSLRRGQADDVALLVNGFFIFVCLRGFKLYRFVTERQVGKLSVWRFGIEDEEAVHEECYVISLTAPKRQAHAQSPGRLFP